MDELHVVINTYNDFEFIEKIKRNYRIIRNASKDIKITIVSDGSTTDFVTLLRNHFPVDNLLILDTNVGPHKARLEAVKNQANSHCLFIDSDDDLVEPFNARVFGVYDFIGCDLKSANKTYEIGKVKSDISLSTQIIMNQATGVMWNKVYLQKDLQRVPAISLRNGEDYFTNLWLRDKIDKMKHVKMPIITYNLRTESLSKAPTPYKYQHLVKMIFVLLRNKKINLREAVLLLWHLVIKNLIRSLKNTDKKLLELQSFARIFKWQ